ncbi:MAG: hypothetical protein IKP99_03485 [Bacteroidales bacterium]|nr:hypothetical protein [Bacteroidales bacterium]
MESYLLPVPRVEALASPFLSERATQNPRRYENSTSVLYKSISNGHPSLLCVRQECVLKLPDFYTSKTKR